jgi:hypothetical protein
MKLLLGFILRASDGTYAAEHAVGHEFLSRKGTGRALCGIDVTLSARPFSDASRPCKRCTAAARRLQPEEP